MSISRPKLLAHAAKSGADIYRQERDLGRLLPRLLSQTAAGRIVEGLRAAEAACEDDRKAGAATYSLARHVGLLAALVAETRAQSHAA
jgi:hypothetical protein